MKKQEVTRYLHVKAEIGTIREQIDELNDMVTRITPVISDMPKGGNGEADRFGEWMWKKEELLNEYFEKLNELIDLQIRIEKWVDSFPDRLRVLARMKYLEGKTYKELAKALDINVTTMWRLDKKLFEIECNNS